MVFVIKSSDIFEANLVMSTLSPEDEMSECQRSRSLVQINSQHENVTIERTDADVNNELEEDNHNVSGSSSSSKKRSLSVSNDNEFDFGVSRQVALDVLRKKRRTSHGRETTLKDASNINEQSKPAPTLQPPIDLESENIDVVFQEDSIPIDPIDQSNSRARELSFQDFNENEVVNGRDHRPFVRQVFRRCFTGNTPKSMSYGQVFAEDSGEE